MPSRVSHRGRKRGGDLVGGRCRRGDHFVTRKAVHRLMIGRNRGHHETGFSLLPHYGHDIIFCIH